MPTNKPLAETGYEKYAGNPFLTYDSLAMAVLLLYFMYLAGQAIVQHHFNGNEYMFALPVFCLLLYFMLGYTFYYFMVSKEYLVIKNHRLTWKKFVYAISNIEAITYVTVNPTNTTRNGTHLSPLLAIRVKIKDGGGEYQYIAKSLGNKTWKAFHEKLLELNIPVSNQTGN